MNGKIEHHWWDEYVFTTEELEAMPVIEHGHADDLHVVDGRVQVWLSRTGRADGEPYDNTVTIEVLDDKGRWVNAVIYNGDNTDELEVQEGHE